jgi:hypothetical protein
VRGRFQLVRLRRVGPEAGGRQARLRHPGPDGSSEEPGWARVYGSQALPTVGLLLRVGLSIDVVSRPAGPLVRVWTARCDSRTDFSSIASVAPGIAFARIDGATTVHLRGPETKATTLSCPADAEYFGADFRRGAYVPMFPPVRFVNLQDALLPTLPDGRILLDGRAWEVPTPHNVDVFIDRLARAGLLVFDPLVEELQHGGAMRAVPERTAQSRFVRAVGVSRRTLQTARRGVWPRRGERSQLPAGTRPARASRHYDLHLAVRLRPVAIAGH